MVSPNSFLSISFQSRFFYVLQSVGPFFFAGIFFGLFPVGDEMFENEMQVRSVSIVEPSVGIHSMTLLWSRQESLTRCYFALDHCIRVHSNSSAVSLLLCLEKVEAVHHYRCWRYYPLGFFNMWWKILQTTNSNRLRRRQL